MNRLKSRLQFKTQLVNSARVLAAFSANTGTHSLLIIPQRSEIDTFLRPILLQLQKPIDPILDSLLPRSECNPHNLQRLLIVDDRTGLAGEASLDKPRGELRSSGCNVLDGIGQIEPLQ